MEYSVEKSEDTARAYGREMDCSPKYCVEIARHIRGMDLQEAKRFLERVIDGEETVAYKRHQTGSGHTKEGGPGGRPVRPAERVLEILGEVESNAVYQGMDEERLVISHIAAHRGQEVRGFRPRAFGRATSHDTMTTNLEVVVGER